MKKSALLSITSVLLAATAQASTCPFDNGASDALNDGVVLTRYALGITGAPLTASTRYSSLDPLQVKGNIECVGCALDMNGDGQIDTVDTTIIARHLAGFQGASLTNGLALGSGTRNSTSLVTSFLAGGCAVGGAINAFVQGGNAFGVPAVLGTNDAQPLTIQSNGTSASMLLGTNGGLRMVLDAAAPTSPIYVAGSVYNVASAGAYGATIAGGGRIGTWCWGGDNAHPGPCGNVATQPFATIGGGYANYVGQGTSGSYAVIAGGTGNYARADYATIGGGVENRAFARAAVVAGGGGNTVSGVASVVGGGGSNELQASYSVIGAGYYNRVDLGADYATIAGGNLNTVRGAHGVVGGGLQNTADGARSAVIGGANNVASGSTSVAAGGSGNVAGADASFAAGTGATVRSAAVTGGSGDIGTFVWSDNTAGGFTSSGPNQFNIKATGGLRLHNNTSQFFGTQTRQMLNLWGTEFGVGVQANTLYQRSASTFSWFIGGVHCDTQNCPGAGGLEHMRLTSTSLVVNGVVLQSSDRALKENITRIDPKALLAKLAALPVSVWNYRRDADKVRHIGPMAQDFKRAFGVGQDDKTIATVDAQGVALAAIQGLHAMLKEKDAEIAALRRKAGRVDAMEADLRAIKRKIGM